jgi:hypothetical protein
MRFAQFIQKLFFFDRVNGLQLPGLLYSNKERSSGLSGISTKMVLLESRLLLESRQKIQILVSCSFIQWALVFKIQATLDYPRVD